MPVAFSPVLFSIMTIAAPLPQISISPAPPQDPLVEPFSPFSLGISTVNDDDDDGFRPKHLTPPPTHLRFSGKLSPKVVEVIPPKGLERDRFEALLKASRERNINASAGTKKTTDLRKEIALKAHKTKQGVLYNNHLLSYTLTIFSAP